MGGIKTTVGTCMTRFLAVFAFCSLLAGTNAYAEHSASDNSMEAIMSQSFIANGTVLDTDGQTIIGASIIEKGTNNGIVTDVDGRFKLSVKKGAQLEVSCIGYKTVTVTAAENMKIILKVDAKYLDEVVVVGFGAQKKENLTGAVASVDVEKTLGSRPIPDVGRGLQGTTPGLNVRVGSNEVGADAVLRIRGQVGSLKGGAAPLILLDNVEIPSLSIVNPDDIESISVLKDAASSSIYGAKAAFGVILINTKKGTKEKETVKVTYTGNFAAQMMAKDYKIAGVEGLHYAVEAAERLGTFTPTGAFWKIDRAGYNSARAWREKYGSSLDDAPFTYGRDWYVDGSGTKIGVRTFDPYHYFIRSHAPSHNHNVSIAGNKGKTNYNVSLGYLNQESLLKPSNNDYYERYNANFRLNTQVNDFINLHAGMMFTKGTKAWAYTGSATSADPWYYIFRWGPTFPIVAYDEYGNGMRNGTWELQNGSKSTKKTLYNSINVGTTITPLKDWNINVDYTYSRTDYQKHSSTKTFTACNTWGSPIPVTGADGSLKTTTNEWNQYNGLGETVNAMKLQYFMYKDRSNVYQDSYSYQQQTWNITSDYALDLFKDHHFNFLIGFNSVAYDHTGVWGQKFDLLNINNPQFDLATGTKEAGGTEGWSSSAGVFGRINYNYKEKYLLEANLRYDGSSKFPTDLQWRWFPSASFGWRVTQEPWMQQFKDVLSSLKVRASWGSIGDQSVPGSLFVPTIPSMDTGWIHNDVIDSPFSTPGLVASDITWQKIQTLDLGFDFELFHQVNVTFDWYSRQTKDMIIGMEGVASSVGAKAPYGNYGALRTNGWELMINWGTMFDNGLSLNVTGTLSDAKTKITEYGTAKGIYGWYPGKKYGEIWGYKVDRLFQNEDFARDASGNLIKMTDDFGSYYQYAKGLDYATQGRISSGKLISGPGDVKFKDLDGDGVINYGKKLIDDHGDLTVIGNSTPRFEYGLRVDAGWKGFDASIFLQGVGKRDMWGSSSMSLPGFNTADGAMAESFANDFWYETIEDGKVVDANYNAFYPRATNCAGASIFNMVPSDRYLINMAYLRIKNITLGYTLPANITQKAYISKARFYISLENFFTFDHLRGLPLDPEEMPGYSFYNSWNYNSGRAGVGIPAYRSASCGVQITF